MLYVFNTKSYNWERNLLNYLGAPFILVHSTNWLFNDNNFFEHLLCARHSYSTRGSRVNKTESLHPRDLTYVRTQNTGLNSSPWPHWPQLTQLFPNENGWDCVWWVCFGFCFERVLELKRPASHSDKSGKPRLCLCVLYTPPAIPNPSTFSTCTSDSSKSPAVVRTSSRLVGDVHKREAWLLSKPSPEAPSKELPPREDKGCEVGARADVWDE